MKKLGRLLSVCALLGQLLTGCNMPLEENRQVEDLLRAPQLAGDYGALQSALNDWLGESAQLKYPLQGELLSPFVLQDLDGDGVQDAAVFYTTAQSTNVYRPAGAVTGRRFHPAGGGLCGLPGGQLSGGLLL